MLIIHSSTIIKNLQEHGLNPAYWYFRFDHITSQDVSKMLRSIIRQLSFFPLPVAIQALLDRHNQHASEPSLEELITALNHIFEIFDGDIFIVLDALDECPNADKDRTRDQLLHCIKCLVTNGPSNLHLLVTSRPEPDIQRELGSVASYSFDIERLIKCDVEKHVELALEGYRLASWTTDVKDQIRKRLLGFEER